MNELVRVATASLIGFVSASRLATLDTLITPNLILSPEMEDEKELERSAAGFTVTFSIQVIEAVVCNVASYVLNNVSSMLKVAAVCNVAWALASNLAVAETLAVTSALIKKSPILLTAVNCVAIASKSEFASLTALPSIEVVNAMLGELLMSVVLTAVAVNVACESIVLANCLILNAVAETDAVTLGLLLTVTTFSTSALTEDVAVSVAVTPNIPPIAVTVPPLACSVAEASIVRPKSSSKLLSKLARTNVFSVPLPAGLLEYPVIVLESN